jgi:hypothetical protein
MHSVLLLPNMCVPHVSLCLFYRHFVTVGDGRSLSDSDSGDTGECIYGDYGKRDKNNDAAEMMKLQCCHVSRVWEKVLKISINLDCH